MLKVIFGIATSFLPESLAQIAAASLSPKTPWFFTTATATIRKLVAGVEKPGGFKKAKSR